MRSPRFKKWFAGLPALNQPQRREVLAALRPAAGLDQLAALLEHYRGERRCPACACAQWHRHGRANGLQRYRCRAYRRTFNDLSGTPLARLRLRGKWIGYLGTLPDAGLAAGKRRRMSGVKYCFILVSNVKYYFCASG